MRKIVPLLALALALVSGPTFAADEMMVVSTSADPGTLGVPVTVQGTNDNDFQGLSIAIEYTTDAIDCVGASIVGTVIEAASPGGVPEFMGVNIDDSATPMTGTATVGIIFDLDPLIFASVAASSDTAQDWVHMLFDVDASALPTTANVDLANDVGFPPVDNHYSSEGFSFLPALTSGTLEINNNFQMRIADQSIIPGGTQDAFVIGDFPTDLNGFQLSITYDNSIVTVTEYPDATEWYAGLDSEQVVPVSSPAIEFFNVQVVPSLPSTPGTGWVGLSAILDALPPFVGQAIPAGVNRTLVKIELSFDAGLVADDTTTISFTNSGVLPDVTLDNVYVVQDGQSALPNTIDGVFTVEDVSGFRRADSNVDSVVNVADAIYIIQWQFVGGAAPPCMDSADANDDGLVNLADTIFIIQWQFAGGIGPAAPGPTNCGDDPTPDTVDCGFYPSC